MLNLSDLSSESLQDQIIGQLRAKILIGEIPPQQLLPSIRALARQQRISVITVQRAYERLIRQGLIHSRRGKGFFVSPISTKKKKAMALQRLTENLAPVIKSALQEGLTSSEIRETLEALSRKE